MRKSIVRLVVSLFYSFLGLSLLILIGCGDPSGDPTATLTLTANKTTVAPGGTVEITATVIRAVGQKTEATEATEATETTEATEATKAATTGPAYLEKVTFTLETPANGGSFDHSTVEADVNGVAMTRYTAGNNYNTDVIVATLENGTSRSIEITKTATTIAVTAAPASVSAGQASVVTATLTGGNNVGVTVTFTMPVNNSGGHLSASSATTDGSGQAQVSYQAGSNNPTLSVSDTVQAAFGSSSGTVAITRTGTATEPEVTSYTVTVSANPATLATDTSNSVITANVKNNLGTVVSGVTVTFTVTGTAPLGTVSPLTATTDSSGNAGTVFTGVGHPAGETNVVTATITVSGTQYTGNAIITYP